VLFTFVTLLFCCCCWRCGRCSLLLLIYCCSFCYHIVTFVTLILFRWVVVFVYTVTLLPLPVTRRLPAVTLLIIRCSLITVLFCDCWCRWFYRCSFGRLFCSLLRLRVTLCGCSRYVCWAFTIYRVVVVVDRYCSYVYLLVDLVGYVCCVGGLIRFVCSATFVQLRYRLLLVRLFYVIRCSLLICHAFPFRLRSTTDLPVGYVRSCVRWLNQRFALVIPFWTFTLVGLITFERLPFVVVHWVIRSYRYPDITLRLPLHCRCRYAVVLRLPLLLRSRSRVLRLDVRVVVVCSAILDVVLRSLFVVLLHVHRCGRCRLPFCCVVGRCGYLCVVLPLVCVTFTGCGLRYGWFLCCCCCCVNDSFD